MRYKTKLRETGFFSPEKTADLAAVHICLEMMESDSSLRSTITSQEAATSWNMRSSDDTQVFFL